MLRSGCVPLKAAVVFCPAPHLSLSVRTCVCQHPLGCPFRAAVLSVTPALCELSRCFQCAFKNRSYGVALKWDPCVPRVSRPFTSALCPRRCFHKGVVPIVSLFRPVSKQTGAEVSVLIVCLLLCHTTALLRSAVRSHSCAVPQLGRCGWNGFTHRVVFGNPPNSVSVVPPCSHLPPHPPSPAAGAALTASALCWGTAELCVLTKHRSLGDKCCETEPLCGSLNPSVPPFCGALLNRKPLKPLSVGVLPCCGALSLPVPCLGAFSLLHPQHKVKVKAFPFLPSGDNAAPLHVALSPAPTATAGGWVLLLLFDAHRQRQRSVASVGAQHGALCAFQCIHPPSKLRILIVSVARISVSSAVCLSAVGFCLLPV